MDIFLAASLPAHVAHVFLAPCAACRPAVAAQEGTGNDCHKPLTITDLSQVAQHVASGCLETHPHQVVNMHKALCSRLLQNNMAERMVWSVMRMPCAHHIMHVRSAARVCIRDLACCTQHAWQLL
jgi:uncharacterized protein (DUF1499 family)